MSAVTANSSTNSSGTRESLLARARRRDADAWRELVELYGPLVAHWGFRRGLDAHQTADLVQEVFASVARKLEAFESLRNQGSFRGWLWTIAANKLRDRARRDAHRVAPRGGSTALGELQQIVDRRDAHAMLDDDEPTSIDRLRSLALRGLEQVRGEFEPQSWDIFQRLIIDQRSTAEVAEEFNKKPSAVRQIRSRVMRRLRQQLGDVD